MARKIMMILIISLLVLFVMLVVAYGFRASLTKSYLTPYLEQYGVQLSCAKWHVQGANSVYADKLCFRYQGHTVTLVGVSLTQQQIHIQQLDMQLADKQMPHSPNGAPATALKLDLPTKRPLVVIDKISIKHAQLLRPLNLSVRERSLNHFTLLGDMHAQIKLQPNQISAAYQLNETILHVLPIPMQLEVEAFELTGNANYTGTKVEADGDFTGQWSALFAPHCELQGAQQGKVSVSYQAQQLQVDASQLNTQLRPTQRCFNANTPVLEPYISPIQHASWQVALRDKLHFANQKLSTEQLSLIALTGKSNTTAQVQLNQPQWRLNTQQLHSQYQLTYHQPQKFALNVNGKLNEQQISGTSTLNVSQNQQVFGVTAKKISATTQFNYVFTQQGELTGQVNIGSLAYQNTRVKQLKLAIAAQLQGSQLNANGQWQSSEIQQQAKPQQNKHIKHAKQHYQLEVDMQNQQAKAELTTYLPIIEHAPIKLRDATISSQLRFANQQLTTTHQLKWQQVNATAQYTWSATKQPFQFTLPSISVSAFNSVLKQISPEATLTQGTVSASANGELTVKNAQWQFALNNVSGLYQDYLFNNLQTAPQGNLNSGGLQLKPTNFTLQELRAGTVVNNIKGKLSWLKQGRLSDITGDVLSGSMALEQILLTDKPQTSQLTLRNIDAAELLALEPQTGISVTGKLGADLPLSLSPKGVTVNNGKLFNQGEGHLAITNNAAFDGIKAQQTELAPILGLLENLAINQIDADVSLAPDGWLDMQMRLKGENKPKKQAVNFNYNHQENIYTLFRALRLSDEITKKVEQEYQKKE